MPSPSSIPAGHLSVESLDWDKTGGLVPAVVQDADTLRVLMVGYMDRDALRATQGTGLVTFYSRSKQRLWTKGETSGHVLELVSVEGDCDDDAVLVLARPRGPTCHLQRASCFPSAPASDSAAGRGDLGFLAELDALVAKRARERPVGSYTTRLFENGVRFIAQKVGEEGVEAALAGVAQNEAHLLDEAADLIFHLVVLLHSRNRSLGDAVQVLAHRHERGSTPAA